MKELSVNLGALKVIKDLLENPKLYGVKVSKLPSGSTLIDAGSEASGGYLAGLKVTEACLGGLGSASITFMDYDGLSLPTITVATDHPAISLLGSQLAGWKIDIEGYSAIGSGPARALALKPRKLYEKINYRDEAHVAVIVLEADRGPPDGAIVKISSECKVEPKNLYIILAPTSSITGFVQISGRIVETGLFRLEQLGLEPLKVLYGAGYAPIMPKHQDPRKAMGIANDALIYGGFTFYIVDFDDDEKLKEIVSKAPSLKAEGYGKPFYETYKEADFDFYKIDKSLFAPAVITINNIKTGITYKAGKINVKVLRQSISLQEA